MANDLEKTFESMCQKLYGLLAQLISKALFNRCALNYILDQSDKASDILFVGDYDLYFMVQ